MALTSAIPEIASKPEIKLVQRFIAEQTTYDPEQKQRVVKENKDISPDFLQSANDPDATFRKKGNKEQVGYVCNLSETCSADNPVQFLTDYTLAKNVKADVKMAEERLPEIKERTGLTDLYTDGDFYGEDTHRKAEEELGVKMHYTDLTGRKPATDKIPLTDFSNVSPIISSSFKAGFRLKLRRLRKYLSKPKCLYKGLVSLFDGKTKKIWMDYGFRLAANAAISPIKCHF